ncbi:hypothetical protein IFM89_002582 [Coptis chinensis]|uniref:Transposase n=1 Tax=Coptis chinensis TaxID=261450 RepID=A0A835HF26_9MAGN|nr:hypothetical protein IFM89_002582 [Coptis chinensis]
MIISFNARLLIDYFAIYVRISFEMVSGQPQPSASQPSGSASHASQPSTSVSHASQPSNDVQESENVRKLPVLIDIDDVVVGDNASRWNTRAGSLIRAHIPVSYTDWRLIHPEFKDKVWNALMREFEVTNVDQALARSHAEKNFSTKFRYGKWVLRKDILGKFETLEEQITACPAGIDPNHWEQFVIYENTSEVMARNAKNGENIKLNDSRHTLGRDTYANMLHKVELVEAAQKKRKNATSSGKGSATHLDFDNDELTEVLGADKRSRTRGISSNLSTK